MTQDLRPLVTLERNNAGTLFIGVDEFDVHTGLAFRSYVLSSADQHTADITMHRRFENMMMLMGDRVRAEILTTAFQSGDRVELHPGTDAWIFGDRYGEVTKAGRKYVHVKLDRSGRTLRFTPDRITPIR